MAAPLPFRTGATDKPDYRSVCKTIRKDTGMKAQELRIGNLVYDSTKNIHRIERLDEKWDFSDRFSIPLTEDWLVKAGARKTHDLLNIFELDRFQLFPFYTYGFWKVVDKETKAYITKVSYVHELQNMYFVLNGEELPL